MTRALRKRCSLSHPAPHGPDEPHFISENGLGHPAAPQLGSPSADKLVGKLSATGTGQVTLDETLGRPLPPPVMDRRMPSDAQRMGLLPKAYLSADRAEINVRRARFLGQEMRWWEKA